MLGERIALKNRGCWRVVRRPKGVRLIKSRYVYKIKLDWTTKGKSELVAQGYQHKLRVDYKETFASRQIDNIPTRAGTNANIQPVVTPTGC